jgi:RNA polymerase sporulation-specific sigma factor
MTEAQTKLVEDNLKLVFTIVNRCYPWLSQDEDVISVGRLGLCKAAMKFDPEKEVAFSSFAWTVILNEIRMYLRKDLRTKGRETNSSEFRFNLEDDEELDIIDVSGSEDVAFELSELSEDLKNAIADSDLTRRQVEIIHGVAQGKNFADIAREFGISREYVRKEFRKIARVISERMNGYGD